MWQSMPRTRWQRWRHALAFGLPLAVLQLVLYTFTITHAKQLTYGPILLDYLPVFLISAVAGYHFCSHWRQKGWESVWAGLRVGLVTWVVFLMLTAIDIGVALIIADNSPPPPTNSRIPYSPSFALIVDVILWGFLAFVSGFSLFVSAAGGGIGSALAAWRVKRLEARV